MGSLAQQGHFDSDIVEQAASAALTLWQANKDSQRRTLICVAGIPGSGKSTLAQQVAASINAQTRRNFCAVVTVDGFHLTRAELAQLPNSAEAFKRRGAPWTFHQEAAVAALGRVVHDESVVLPGFDHAVKDPVPDQIRVSKDTKIVLADGLYLLLQDEPWVRLDRYADAFWLVACDIDTAMDRVARRHLSSGIEPTIEKAHERANSNDRLNASYIVSHSRKPDLVIQSG